MFPGLQNKQTFNKENVDGCKRCKMWLFVQKTGIISATVYSGSNVRWNRKEDWWRLIVPSFHEKKIPEWNLYFLWGSRLSKGPQK